MRARSAHEPTTEKMAAASAVNSNGINIQPDSSIETLTSVKDVAQKVTSAIQKDVHLHDTLKRRVDELEVAFSNEVLTSSVILDHVASVTICVETLSRRLGFGSHSGINHCRGCVPLKTAAARACLLASQLRSALKMGRLESRETFYIVTWLELLVHSYVQAFLLDETKKEAAGTEALVLVATGLERWTDFARLRLANVYLHVEEENERFGKPTASASGSASGNATGTKK